MGGCVWGTPAVGLGGVPAVFGYASGGMSGYSSGPSLGSIDPLMQRCGSMVRLRVLDTLALLQTRTPDCHFSRHSLHSQTFPECATPCCLSVWVDPWVNVLRLGTRCPTQARWTARWSAAALTAASAALTTQGWTWAAWTPSSAAAISRWTTRCCLPMTHSSALTPGLAPAAAAPPARRCCRACGAPIGLKLRKSASLLDLINSQLGGGPRRAPAGGA